MSENDVFNSEDDAIFAMVPALSQSSSDSGPPSQVRPVSSQEDLSQEKEDYEEVEKAETKSNSTSPATPVQVKRKESSELNDEGNSSLKKMKTSTNKSVAIQNSSGAATEASVRNGHNDGAQQNEEPGVEDDEFKFDSEDDDFLANVTLDSSIVEPALSAPDPAAEFLKSGPGAVNLEEGFRISRTGAPVAVQSLERASALFKGVIDLAVHNDDANVDDEGDEYYS